MSSSYFLLVQGRGGGKTKTNQIAFGKKEAYRAGAGVRGLAAAELEELSG